MSGDCCVCGRETRLGIDGPTNMLLCDICHADTFRRMEQGLPPRPLGQLHVYGNDVVEWVVALSPADAAVVMAANLLQNGYDETFLQNEADLEFKQEPDTKFLTIHEYMNASGECEEEERTCRAWADEHGRGFLCTTEF